MDLHEVAASSETPYKCYVRGNNLKTEGDNIQTLGFHNDSPVVQESVIEPQLDTTGTILPKTIDLSKLKRVFVKIDPETGRKYIDNDGKKIEVQTKQNMVLKQFNFLNMAPPQLVPNEQAKKILVGGKYLKLNGNAKMGVNVATMTDESDDVIMKKECGVEASTQTEPGEYLDSIIGFLLGDTEKMADREEINIDQLKTKEEIRKFSFFNDMRNALNLDRSGNLSIHNNVMLNNLKEVQKNCVVLKAIKENVNILNQQSYAPLHLAIIHNVQIDIIKTLIKYGADMGVCDPEGNCPIHLAIDHNRGSIFHILVASAISQGVSLDLFNYEGFTPLIVACMNGRYKEATDLLQYGSDPNIRDMKSGRSALFHAAEARDGNLVELLIRYRADTKLRNFFGTSPHDAMFELDNIPHKIKVLILGRNYAKIPGKKKLEVKLIPPAKKRVLETTPVLKKVTHIDLMPKPRRR